MKIQLSITTLLGLFVGVPAAAEAPLNLFEWSAVAPIVATAYVIGDDGGYTDVRIHRTFRGNVVTGNIVRVALRRANRDRSRSSDPKALRFDEGKQYVFLLEEFRPKPAKVAYRLVRGVRGSRAVPVEGDEAFLDALSQFIEIHELKSDSLAWRRFAGMLEQNNPLLLQVSMDQMLKFRRGEPELVLSLRPLLDHPRPDLRVRAVRLMGQLVERHGPDAFPAGPDLRSELLGAARRDPAIEVRVAATEALWWFQGPALVEILQKIAEADPERSVRYAAQRLLLRSREETAR